MSAGIAEVQRQQIYKRRLSGVRCFPTDTREPRREFRAPVVTPLTPLNRNFRVADQPGSRRAAWFDWRIRMIAEVLPTGGGNVDLVTTHE